MIKLNSILYNKLILQAEEAKERKFIKLADGVTTALNDEVVSNQNYSYENLQNDVYTNMWKMAFNILGYHDLESVDVQKLDETITTLSSHILNSIEENIDKENKVGPNEPLLPGQHQ